MTTAKLALPELDVSQAGKEITHNQALAILDQVVSALVVDKDLSTPPGSPANGAMYIVKATGLAAWAGHNNHLAFWLDAVAAWTFVVPWDGCRVWVADEKLWYHFNGSAWIAAQVGYQTGAGGSVTQATSRTTGVTLNKSCGAITLFSTTTAAAQLDTFTLTNSLIAAGDVVAVSVKTATGVYLVSVTAVAAGSCKISVFTPAAVGSAEAPVLNFAIVKAVAA